VGPRIAYPEGVTDDSFEITYAAHTASCTFLLDAEGFCRRIVVSPSSTRSLTKKGRDMRSVAARCIGAQYVASLDPAVSGLLADKPRVGASMLFARVDERGRVSLVRTGVVTKLDTHREDPFAEPAEAPSTSVETSAPSIPPSEPMPRFERRAITPPAPYEDPYGEGTNDRTQQIHALRPAAFLRNHPAAAEAEPRADEHPTLDRATFDIPEPATKQDRPSEPPRRELRSAPRCSTWPSAGLDLDQAPTVRHANANIVSEGEHDLHAALARGPLPRPSPPAPRMRSERVRTSVEPSLHALEQLARRRGVC
jgi:hypothetical protein